MTKSPPCRCAAEDIVTAHNNQEGKVQSVPCQSLSLFTGMSPQLRPDHSLHHTPFSLELLRSVSCHHGRRGRRKTACHIINLVGVLQSSPKLAVIERTVATSEKRMPPLRFCSRFLSTGDLAGYRPRSQVGIHAPTIRPEKSAALDEDARCRADVVDRWGIRVQNWRFSSFQPIENITSTGLLLVQPPELDTSQSSLLSEIAHHR